MIAKLIVWDRDRPRALARMRAALAQYRVVGVSNNVEFLQRLVTAPAFAHADLDTALIERENAVLFPAPQPVPQAVWALAALAELQREGQGVRDDSPWSVLDGWRLNSTAQRTLTLRFGDEVQAVGVSYVSGGHGHVLTIGGQSLTVRGQFGPSGTVHAQLGERRVSAAVVTSGERRQVFFEGRSWPVTVVGALSSGGGGDDHAGGLKAPMPGKVIALIAAAGSVVEKGAPLLVLEAMKMEHTISAPAKGLVKAFHFAAGDQVTDGVDLVDFEVEVQP
jgi:3-methylcrotonyl-CoA carboxylase alpha subunit